MCTNQVRILVVLALALCGCGASDGTSSGTKGPLGVGAAPAINPGAMQGVAGGAPGGGVQNNLGTTGNGTGAIGAAAAPGRGLAGVGGMTAAGAAGRAPVYVAGSTSVATNMGA